MNAGKQDRLKRLLQDELRAPFTKLDQINTVIWDDFEDADDEDGPQQLLVVLRRLLAIEPRLIGALNRAVGAEGGDWLELVWEILPKESEADGLALFVNMAIDASNARLSALHAGIDQAPFTLYRVRLLMQPPNKEGGRDGVLYVDFKSAHSPMPACYDALAIQTVDYPMLLLSLICQMAEVDVFHADDRRKPIMPGPMFRYHPERMRASRAYLKGVAPWAILKGLPSARGEDLQRLGNAFTGEMAATHLDYSILQREAVGLMDMTGIKREEELATTWLAYVGAGREIFDIPHRLADMFALSDCDDVQLEQIRTPYKGQYIHFGPREELPLAPGWYCDGAYVLASDGCMTVRLTAAPSTPAELLDWRIRPEPCVSFRFEAEDQALDVGTAVDTAVARTLGELRAEGLGASKQQAELDAAAEDLGLPGSVKVVTEERAALEAAMVLSTREVGHRALTLVVNALCYLTAYPEDVEHRWPGSAPARLLEQLEGGTPGRRKRAEQQLHSEGFSKVRLCGRTFRERAHASLQDAGTIRSHWRRGHFRSQVHGPGRQLRKLVWIMPVLVNAATMSDDTQLPGHLYLVDAASDPVG